MYTNVVISPDTIYSAFHFHKSNRRNDLYSKITDYSQFQAFRGLYIFKKATAVFMENFLFVGISIILYLQELIS